ncbi:hypothetical protein VTO42DRAFT_879 [Malbranchea cinnamomea]
MTMVADIAARFSTPDGDVNRGPAMSIVSWTECGVALALLLARIWTRLHILRTWGWDDVFMGLAMVCAALNSALLQISIRHGTGRHIRYLSEHQAMLANKYNWISQGFHVMSTNWGKVSVAIFLLRMVDRAKQQRSYFYAGIALLNIVNAASIGIIYGQCHYTSDLWTKPSERKGSCWDPSIHTSVAYAQGSFSAFSDFVLAIYPVFIIWNLHIVRRLKIIVTFVMMLGILAMVAAIVKTTYLNDLGARSDYTFATATLSIWVATEQYIIIIAACIPPLGPLFKRLVKYPSTRKSTRLLREGNNAHKAKGPVSHFYHGRGTGKFNSLRSGAGPDFQGYPLAEYTVATWIRTRHDDGSLKEMNSSEEAIVSNRLNSADDSSRPGGIIRTLEVQVQSDTELIRQRATLQ